MLANKNGDGKLPSLLSQDSELRRLNAGPDFVTHFRCLFAEIDGWVRIWRHSAGGKMAEFSVYSGLPSASWLPHLASHTDGLGDVLADFRIKNEVQEGMGIFRMRRACWEWPGILPDMVPSVGTA